jgi:peptidoglycan hydrolase CwlO-like protein
VELAHAITLTGIAIAAGSVVTAAIIRRSNGKSSSPAPAPAPAVHTTINTQQAGSDLTDTGQHEAIGVSPELCGERHVVVNERLNKSEQHIQEIWRCVTRTEGNVKHVRTSVEQVQTALTELQKSLDRSKSDE